MKRRLLMITGTAVAVALASLGGALSHLLGNREVAESEPGKGGREVADPQDEDAPSIEDRAAKEEHREVRVATAAEPLAPPDEPVGFRDWMQSQDWAEFAGWAAESLQAQFGESIAQTRNQVSLLELRRYLMENFPEDWHTKLSDLLHRAFPNAAQQILTTFSKMDRYDEWFEKSKFDLAAMQHEEIKEALWKKREEIFGKDATQIWATDSESGHFGDLMEILEEASDVPLEDRLELFMNSVEETNPAGADPLMQDKSHVMALAFLNMESVQSELRQMSPEERAESLRYIRRSMGIDEAAIERMEKLDAKRERRWHNGLRYMEERDHLARQYEGSALEEELRFLRARYFGDEASTIEAEEASGFFRYQRRRIYERN